LGAGSGTEAYDDFAQPADSGPAESKRGSSAQTEPRTAGRSTTALGRIHAGTVTATEQEPAMTPDPVTQAAGSATDQAG
jgi:hypothetical protein